MVSRHCTIPTFTGGRRGAPAGCSPPQVFTYASFGNRAEAVGKVSPFEGRPVIVAALVSVVVVDDHPFFRDGVSRGLTLDGRCRVVGEAGTGREALETIRDQDPDVALVDFQMPDMDGVAVVHALKREGSRTRVLLVSAITEGAIVFRALEEGAAGYLSKEAPRSSSSSRYLKSLEARRYYRATWPVGSPPRSGSGLSRRLRS